MIEWWLIIIALSALGVIILVYCLAWKYSTGEEYRPLPRRSCANCYYGLMIKDQDRYCVELMQMYALQILSTEDGDPEFEPEQLVCPHWLHPTGMREWS